MNRPRIGELCAGYGGLFQAVQSVLGGELAFVADNDPGAAKILAHRYPDVPNHGDITTIDWVAAGPVDVLTAGFPCQPVSLAGKRLGEADERWIWPEVASAVRALRPGLVVLENVSALVVRGLAGVVADLAAIGYVGSWVCVRACDAGAPHRRERIFVTAWPAEDTHRTAGGERRQPAPGQATGWWSRADAGGSGGAPAAADTDNYTARARREPEDAGRRRTESAQCCGVAAYTPGDGRDQGRAEPAGLLRGPDAAERGHAPADADSAPGGRHGPRRGPGPLQGPPVAERAPQQPRRLHSGSGDQGAMAWGAYEPAIRRWETILGRPAPRPTEPGRTGERLSPAFVEWMQGLPEGWVTGVPGLSRNAQLKALGNGVVPQQAAMALRLLLARTEAQEAA